MIEEYLNLYRFRPDYSQQEIAAMHDHFYHLFMMKGTSEYAIMTLFDDQIYPKIPMFAKDKLGKANELKFPISFIMGEDDWVNEKLLNSG